MTRHIIDRPAESEYAPYYGKYVSLVPDGDIVEILRQQLEETLIRLGNIPESRGSYTYQEGKWTIKDLVGHLIDTERVFAYRALRMARGDKKPLAGIEQDDYVRTGEFNRRTLQHLLLEFECVRNATILLFEPLSEEAWMQTGTASDCPFSVRAIAYLLAGHDLHHMNILNERYLENR